MTQANESQHSELRHWLANNVLDLAIALMENRLLEDQAKDVIFTTKEALADFQEAMSYVSEWAMDLSSSKFDVSEIDKSRLKMFNYPKYNRKD